jgi:hypothetical protein
LLLCAQRSGREQNEYQPECQPDGFHFSPRSLI